MKPILPPFLRTILAFIAAAVFGLFLGAVAQANHPDAQCELPEVIMDSLAEKHGGNWTMEKLSKLDALAYLVHFTLLTGNTPPLDPAKVTGMVAIHAPHSPNVYSGVIDGPNGEVCHAAPIPVKMHKGIMALVQKGGA